MSLPIVGEQDIIDNEKIADAKDKKKKTREKEQEEQQKRDDIYGANCDDLIIKFPIIAVYRCNSKDCKMTIARDNPITNKEEWHNAKKHSTKHSELIKTENNDFKKCIGDLVFDLKETIKYNPGRIEKKKINKDEDKDEEPDRPDSLEEEDTFDTVIMTKSMEQGKEIADRWFYKGFKRGINPTKRLLTLFGPYGFGKSTFIDCLHHEKKYREFCRFEELSLSKLMPGKIGSVEDAINEIIDADIELYIKKGISTVHTLDEKEIVLNSRDDKSSKELAMVTGVLLSKMGKPWKTSPGYFFVIATNREFDMDGAATDRSEDVYFDRFEPEVMIEFLKRSITKAKKAPTSISDDDYKGLVCYVTEFNGRIFADISNKLEHWYMDRIDGIKKENKIKKFKEGHVLKKEELEVFLNELKLFLEKKKEIRQTRIPKRKPYFRDRIGDNDPNKPIIEPVHIPDVSRIEKIQYINNHGSRDQIIQTGNWEKSINLYGDLKPYEDVNLQRMYISVYKNVNQKTDIKTILNPDTVFSTIEKSGIDKVKKDLAAKLRNKKETELLSREETDWLENLYNEIIGTKNRTG